MQKSIIQKKIENIEKNVNAKVTAQIKENNPRKKKLISK